jgi:hypothetical protein
VALVPLGQFQCIAPIKVLGSFRILASRIQDVG